MLRYKLRPEEVEENLDLLRAVFDELREVRPEGLGYATYRLEDGLTFVGVVELAEGPELLRELEAFQRYRATLEERCSEPPVLTTLYEVDSYGSG